MMGKKALSGCLFLALSGKRAGECRIRELYPRVAFHFKGIAFHGSILASDAKR